MQREFTDAELAAFLDEDLGQEQMAAVEAALRSDPRLSERLTKLVGQRNAGIHSLGGIWRKHRLSCPTREQLGSLLLGVLEPQHASYIQFHVDTVGCRLCQANLDDLREQASAHEADTSETRRRRYYQSSVGYLSRNERP